MSHPNNNSQHTPRSNAQIYSQQNYSQQGFAQQPQQNKTNTLAIISLVTSFFVGLVGVICAHIALRQIKRTGEGGKGLAIAGLVIGYIATAILVAVVAIWIVVAIQVGNAISEISEQPGTSQSQPNEELDEPEAGAIPENNDARTDEYTDSYCALVERSFEKLASIDIDADTPETREAIIDEVRYMSVGASPHQSEYLAVAKDPSLYDDRILELMRDDERACAQQ